ncbi:TraR/DksA C4-type zinc finger protein [Patescibacteria group bacterium]|nr:TraR/DksA C4-type zinc finger protein [Patescibacteria group bacterium]MDE1946660.1 TraR/DksA C4-type zinc finger protein [Patescibacteria group bacterium]MDE2010613.1 TraR/DksA C4-type zinc finger protein [Patescibacteria group bacterium]MDE2232940.1 TraR/DksA C4-type zinc finger protein [Patescibacteria group bacterium]
MTKRDLEYFKKKLLAEKADIEAELSGISQKDSSGPGGWEATSGKIEVDAADENEVADKFEELEENAGIAGQLENQLSEINSALDRIANGTYGICEKCGEPIERERLDANPSARISIKHLHK